MEGTPKPCTASTAASFTKSYLFAPTFVFAPNLASMGLEECRFDGLFDGRDPKRRAGPSASVAGTPPTIEDGTERVATGTKENASIRNIVRKALLRISPKSPQAPPTPSKLPSEIPSLRLHLPPLPLPTFHSPRGCDAHRAQPDLYRAVGPRVFQRSQQAPPDHPQHSPLPHPSKIVPIPKSLLPNYPTSPTPRSDPRRPRRFRAPPPIAPRLPPSSEKSSPFNPS